MVVVSKTVPGVSPLKNTMLQQEHIPPISSERGLLPTHPTPDTPYSIHALLHDTPYSILYTLDNPYFSPCLELTREGVAESPCLPCRFSLSSVVVSGLMITLKLLGLGRHEQAARWPIEAGLHQCIEPSQAYSKPASSNALLRYPA